MRERENVAEEPKKYILKSTVLAKWACRFGDTETRLHDSDEELLKPNFKLRLETRELVV